MCFKDSQKSENGADEGGNMYSIGVDIGTSTTEIIISNICISTKQGNSLLPVTSIDQVQIVYRSPVFFTPLNKNGMIDFDEIKENVRFSLNQSGIPKENIDTGAVIITGETARKENALQVNNTLSEYLGDFVVATAGAKLESVLAARGAGICEESKKINKKILNLDIGGGTLNAAVFDKGELVQTFAMDIGGRLIRYDSDMRITYISDRIRFIIDEKSLPITLGKSVQWETLERLCESLADDCLQACGLKKITQEAKRLYITEFVVPEGIDFFTVSGGVGACMCDCSDCGDTDLLFERALKFGDIGPILGQKLKKALTPFDKQLLIPKERIMATVIGAGNHTLTVSGNTVGFDEKILPIRNIPIIKSDVSPENWCHLAEKTVPLMAIYEDDVPALGINGKRSPTYTELKILAAQIVQLYKMKSGAIIILMQEDFAKALYQVMRLQTDCAKPVICLDGIDFERGDYIDIGKPVGHAVPIVIKTLLYNS